MVTGSIANRQYHRVLRVAAVVCAFVLTIESGLLSDSTHYIMSDTSRYVASVVGMSASIEPTELNQYTAALTQKERELEAWEAALNQREIAVSVGAGESDSDRATYLLAGVLFILLVLILLNYTLDYLRAREEREAQPV